VDLDRQTAATFNQLIDHTRRFHTASVESRHSFGVLDRFL